MVKSVAASRTGSPNIFLPAPFLSTFRRLRLQQLSSVFNSASFLRRAPLFSHLRTRVAPYFKRHISNDHASSTSKMSMLAAGLPPLHHTAGLPLGVSLPRYRVTLLARHQLHINATSRYPETMREMEKGRAPRRIETSPESTSLPPSILVN